MRISDWSSNLCSSDLAQANRDGNIGIIVFDISLVDNSILSVVQDVKFIPSIGFISIIDSQKGDYRNLSIAYMLARDIAINSINVELDQNILKAIINRIIKDLNDIISIKSLVYKLEKRRVGK